MVWSAEKQVYDFQLTSISTTLSCLQLFSRVPHSFLFQQNPQYVQPFPSSCWFFYHFTFNNILIRPSCLRTHRSHLCFRRQILSKIYSFLSVCHLILPLFINFFFFMSVYQSINTLFLGLSIKTFFPTAILAFVSVLQYRSSEIQLPKCFNFVIFPLLQAKI